MIISTSLIKIKVVRSSEENRGERDDTLKLKKISQTQYVPMINPIIIAIVLGVQKAIVLVKCASESKSNLSLT